MEIWRVMQNPLSSSVSEDKGTHFSCWTQGGVSSWTFKLEAMPE